MNSNQKQTIEARGHWGSKLGFTVAAIGSAVGLGNIWKFPYIVGESGGAAFIAVYLLCIAFVGFPILLAEWMIGRRAKCNPVESFKVVAEEDGGSKNWSIIGFVAVLASFFLLSFYSVIGGWTIHYFFHGISGHFNGMTSASTGELYNELMNSPYLMGLTHTVFLGLTVYIVAQGVGSGIERASKVMMPVLMLILGGLLIYASQTTGFWSALDFLFYPRWENLTSDALLVALGHAFFTLSLGTASMVSYGSFLEDSTPLLRTGFVVVFSDTFIALSAGLVIFPIVFTNGLDATSGPGLLFETLPLAFSNMGLGTWLGVPFFLLIAFAALTSSISMLEPSVEWISESLSLSRKTTSILLGICIWMLGFLTVGSMNFMKDVTIFNKTFFELIDFTISAVALPLGGFFTIVFAGWVMSSDRVTEQLGLNRFGVISWKIIARFVAPLAVLTVFLHGTGVFS